MRLPIVIFAVAMFAALGLQGQTPVPAAKKTLHKSAAKTTSSAKTRPQTTAVKSTSKTAHRRVAATAKAAAPARQQTPTQGRYKEIQQALVDKGYFSGPADGSWGAGSVDALKRFQRDQSLADDGKIGSLSLIALGLGPKRTVSLDSATDKPVQE